MNNNKIQLIKILIILLYQTFQYIGMKLKMTQNRY